jgi:hypothetical protein
MPVVDEIKSDIKAAKKLWVPWWVVLFVGIGGFLFYSLFDQFGIFDLARPTGISILVFGLLFAVKRTLRRRLWFWATMTILAGLHVLVILFIPWTTNWVPAATVAGIASVDLCAMLAILDVVASFVEGPRT